MYGIAYSINHRAVSVSDAGWFGRTAREPGAESGTSSPTPDAAVIIEESWLWHHIDRQVASGLAAGFQSAQERLRSLLGFSRRRSGLFHSQVRAGQYGYRRSMGCRCENPPDRIFDGSDWRPCGVGHQ